MAALPVLAAGFVGMLGFATGFLAVGFLAVGFLAGLEVATGDLTVDFAVFFEAITDFLGAETEAKVFGLSLIHI